MITVSNVSLPKAKMIKLKPQHVDFLEISNPKAVLEFALRNFSCVTKGDVIQIPYNNKNYQFELKEVEPQDAACIIETDCNLEFDAPVGYKEPAPSSMGSAHTAASSMSKMKPESAFADGQNRSECPSPATASAASSVTDMQDDNNNDNNNPSSNSSGIRIVNGQVIRPDSNAATGPTTDMLAEKTGATGVQKNAAIPQAAPQIDYWAVNVGESGGARLDGKKPAELKDAAGNVVDVRKLRAEAAARRAAAAVSASAAELSARAGQTVEGTKVAADEAAAHAAKKPTAPVSKRKKRVGSKFSQIKGSSTAFQGNANSMG